MTEAVYGGAASRQALPGRLAIPDRTGSGRRVWMPTETYRHGDERGSGPCHTAAVLSAAADEVVLCVPARPKYGRVARIGAASLGLRLQMSFGAIDDLRRVVDETFVLLLDGTGTAGRTKDCDQEEADLGEPDFGEAVGRQPDDSNHDPCQDGAGIESGCPGHGGMGTGDASGHRGEGATDSQPDDSAGMVEMVFRAENGALEMHAVRSVGEPLSEEAVHRFDASVAGLVDDCDIDSARRSLRIRRSVEDPD